MDEGTAPLPESKPEPTNPAPPNSARPTPSAMPITPKPPPTTPTPAANEPTPMEPPLEKTPPASPKPPKTMPAEATPSEASPASTPAVESAPPASPKPAQPKKLFPKPPSELPTEQTLSPMGKPTFPSEPIPTPTIPTPVPVTQPAPLPYQGVEARKAFKKILLVDDDEIFTNLYASVFKTNGINCSIAEHGLEALDAAKEEKPDLILLDIMMPDINGLEVLKRLKADPETANIPVWMLTNLVEQIDQETAGNLGCGGYLVKSSNTPKQICEKINAFFAGVIDKP